MSANTKPVQDHPRTALLRAAPISRAVEAAVVLGWDMAALYAFATPRRLARPEFPHPEPPAALTNLSAMDARPRLELQLDGIDVRVRLLDTQLDDALPGPLTTEARNRLAELGHGDDAGGRFRLAVDDLNKSLLRWLIATDSRVGAAYRLGRALSESCQDKPDRLNEVFCSGRGKEITHWMEDLATALPPYSSTVVRGSFGKWRRAVCDPAAEIDDLVGARRASSVPDQYERRVSAALPDQGRVWRNLLTGGLDPRDLLTQEDYQQHIERLLVHNRALILSSARRLFVPILLPLLVVVALSVTVVAFAKTGTPLSEIAAALLAVAGGAVAGWKLVSASAAKALATVSEPFRDAQLAELMVKRATRPLEEAIRRSLADAPHDGSPAAVPKSPESAAERAGQHPTGSPSTP